MNGKLFASLKKKKETMSRIDVLLMLILFLCSVNFVTIMIVILAVMQKTKQVETFVGPLRAQFEQYL